MKLYQNIIKRTFDFLAALIGLLIIAPLLLVLIIILTITNNGKPFFYQKRTGKHGHIFTIIKLKTMTDKTDSNGQLLPEIQRITKVGDICRKYSLDEIPQLINILKGDMSLIGPRPLLPSYLPLYNKTQNRRHEVMPGITGWAQVNGRNAISWEKKFEYDVYYVDNQSIALDFKILIKTIDKVINRKDINNSDSVNMPIFKGTKE
ncbi:lipopolysaccharide/colanic/teichoic acid biosynthesis glycosyltransferase [Winogradskyella epiphytica]|uniref:Lipopolysaccharide/colanic/teichoic acid biosynthesis glycosyltransferase n=1 Tax=Winogradskyella epiphytica TaxID=262005 RepID=A0A2V4WXH8_9FLAO|nr:sugar transferase [Winogradskyella epiphytica]PYE81712.1 lipopolysaccharide/colanic/teichoic acid biosynthesis glycosyltransferase [Winogradskyella epiphytica]GGW63210.1 sugar transferase [Winogradskyella epiphytica]